MTTLVFGHSNVSCKRVVSLVPMRHKASTQVMGLGVVNAGGAVAVNGRLRVEEALSPSRLCDSTFIVSGASVGSAVPNGFVLANTN